ncbi:unnamed protein product [Polarella glacialis]|uniref:Histidine phosphatase family protein n=2 Tax=Polarella glacialis TaxID=89957 RepID=A0A813JA10_POLGL|nr:unnamed protein product [Polarella glacialis]
MASSSCFTQKPPSKWLRKITRVTASLAIAVATFQSLAAVLPGTLGLRFLLARHGQTTFNAAKRFQGSMNEEPVLTEKGVAQARELGDWLSRGLRPDETSADRQIGSLFVSPLRRARQTLDVARKVASEVLPAEAAVLPELREIDLYEWEGRTQAEVNADSPELFRLWKTAAWELRLGGGRPVVLDLWERAASAWGLMRQAASASNREAPSLVVAHGTLGKALLGTALGLPAQAFRHFTLQNGEVVEVAWPETGSDQGALWRRRHPETGPWRSLLDEQAAMRGASEVP